MSEVSELLPLGTAVQIQDDDGVYVIIARGFQKHDDGFLAGYKGVPHPRGAAAGVREIVIRQTQITNIVHRGYHNERDTAFAEELLENAKTPPPAPVPSAPEPDLTVDLTAPAAVSPPAATGVPPGAMTLDIVSDAKDPFGELRRKGKRI